MPGAKDVLSAIQDADMVRLRDLLDEEPALARATRGDGVTVLQMALYLRRHDAVRLLLQKGALQNVYEAAVLGDVAALRRLLAAAPERLDTPGPDGFPPLHLAAHFGKHDALEWLLERGADLHVRSTDANRNTALHAAAAGGVVATAKILLSSGADADAKDAGGNTPLHVAAANGSVPVVQALLDGGANPRLRNADRATASQVAAERDQGEVVEILAKARSAEASL